jgi:hypothetical protein
MNSELLAHELRRSLPRRVGTFVLHFLEMIIAMVVGMTMVFPLWELATRGEPATSWLMRFETQSLVMVSAMALPMAAWMRLRRHPPTTIARMCSVMYAGFLVVFPLHWARTITDDGTMMLGHALMVVFMLIAMLVQRQHHLRKIGA